MKIAIVAPAVNTGGERGFYNRQEVGLARSLAALGHIVEIDKAVPCGHAARVESIAPGGTLRENPTWSMGSHGWFDARRLEAFGPDAVVMFTDLQLAVPSVAAWCARRSIPWLPYVGTMATNRKGHAAFARLSAKRNLGVLRRGPVLAKTESVADELRACGVEKVVVAPVGLDETDLRAVSPAERTAQRAQWGVDAEPVLGFVGQMLPFKDPLRLVPVLERLRNHAAWRLALVGDGPLAGELEKALAQRGLNEAVHWKRRLPHSEMPEFYVSIDLLVNLNPTEIFGMSLLEAMYYGKPVVAVEAPGPRSIVRPEHDGLLCANDPSVLASAVERAYHDRGRLGSNAKARVAESFTWGAAARAVLDLLEKGA